MFRVDRRLLLAFDWPLLATGVFLLGMGLLTLWSLSPNGLFLRQLLWAGVGFAGFLVLISIDYRVLASLAYPAYALGVGALAFVLLWGHSAQGARRWLSLGIVTVQPSELFKLAFVLALARYLAGRELRPEGRGGLLVPLGLLALPAILIVRQPDLGTALVLLPVFTAMLFIAGVRLRVLGVLAGAALLAAPGLWFLLKGYQRERLLVYLDPVRDPMGSAWSVIQAKIAIGSGQFLGKGLFGATQSQLAFLPERHTDFIFATFAESWGFLGALLILAAYLFLALRGIEVATTARDGLGSLIAGGATALLISQILVNLGMVVGLLPVVGLPLPLMSYGGSALVTAFGALALIVNVRMRRFA